MLNILFLLPVCFAASSLTTLPPSTITSAPAASATPSKAALATGNSPLPLTEYTYAYPNIPYQVNPFPVGRGPQSGYSLCNDTTAGPTSNCQTAFVNNLADFCLWGSPVSNGLIGNIEAAVISYCSNNKTQHGSRLMPPGTLTGVQFMRTSAYIQVTGTINMTGVNLDITDTGGELDPHGADLLGNPLGGLMFTTAFSADNTTITQATSWNNFIGASVFCMKLCDPKVTSPNYCENRFDLLGCAYNAPAAYKVGEFMSCNGDLQSVAGTYTSGGATLTWSQPESLAPGTVLPWTPVVPASSQCVTFKSADLYGALPTTSTPSSAGATATGGAAAGSSGSKTGSSSSPSATAAAKSGAGKTIVSVAGVAAGVLMAFVL